MEFEAAIRAAQDSICGTIEEVDGTPFREDAWARQEGGGGISRVLQGGNVWEKAGVNVSVVYGGMPIEAYRSATDKTVKDAPKVSDARAAGLSAPVGARMGRPGVFVAGKRRGGWSGHRGPGCAVVASGNLLPGAQGAVARCAVGFQRATPSSSPKQSNPLRAGKTPMCRVPRSHSLRPESAP